MDVNYKMGYTLLGTNLKENDIEVAINADTNVPDQCDIAPSKGNQIVWLTRRNITHKEKHIK